MENDCNGSKLSQMVANGPKQSQVVTKCPIWTQSVPNGQEWFNVVSNVHNCSHMVSALCITKKQKFKHGSDLTFDVSCNILDNCRIRPQLHPSRVKLTVVISLTLSILNVLWPNLLNILPCQSPIFYKIVKLALSPRQHYRDICVGQIVTAVFKHTYFLTLSLHHIVITNLPSSCHNVSHPGLQK